MTVTAMKNIIRDKEIGKIPISLKKSLIKSLTQN